MNATEPAAVDSVEPLLLPETIADESRHSRQLQEGFHGLRFRPELEAQYRQDHEQAIRPRVALALLLGILVSCLHVVMSWLGGGPAATEPVLLGIQLGMLLPAPMLGLVLIRLPRLADDITWIAGLVALISGAAVMTLNLAGSRLGMPFPYEGLIIIYLFVLFISGLRFHPAMLVCGLMTLAYVGTAALTGADAALLNGYHLVTVLAVSAVGAWMLNYQTRSNYLSQAALKAAALHDELTGVCNRRFLRTLIEPLSRQAAREARQLLVCLVDIDDFKAYNDKCGHAEGDRVLQAVAAALESVTRRPLDFTVRYGGEEFLLYFYGVEADQVEALVGRIRSVIADLGIAHPASRAARQVTVSGGYVLGDAPDEPAFDALVKRADAALYAAKEAGRDQLLPG